jgi:glycosyltransferase involved in cell wall biosynthesis
MLSVIICTIRRPEVILGVLDCLAAQTYRNLEVLVVGASTAPDFRGFEERLSGVPNLRFLTAPKGLAPARNVGMRNAVGDLICFLDDDVSFAPDFFAQVIECFGRPELNNMGGLTAYDEHHYPSKVNARWRLRAALGITPSLRPGDSNSLGRSVPLSFFEPFSGFKEVKWLPGFCQIFRRAAINENLYDEEVIVEDRDFSMTLGQNWKLLICGDLKIAHHMDDQSRHAPAKQVWRAAFGLGRSYAKRSRSFVDKLSAVHLVIGEFLIDLVVLATRPSLNSCRIPVARLRGFASGFASWRSGNKQKQEV